MYPLGMAKIRRIQIGPKAVDAVRRGHPWIFKNPDVRGLDAAAAGEEVSIAAQDGSFLGRGIADPQSALAVRVWTLRDEPVAGLLEPRVEAAFALRARFFPGSGTSAYRLIHGEGDRLPGFVIDRYGTNLVLRTDGDASATHAEEFANIVWKFKRTLEIERLVWRKPTASRKWELVVLHGSPPPDEVEVTEHGVPFVVDLRHGQKTGAFLDQRENRKRVGELAKGRRVLNLFSYAGGFSLRAALGGATAVTSVDIAASAHATAQRSFRAAGVDPAKHSFVTADVFAFLEQAEKRGQTWDLVISDPPSFAPNEKSLGRALAAYKSLHRACAGILETSGIFCASSCSSHVDAETFLGTLNDGACGRSDLRLLEAYGQPLDHPTLAAWPEGRYLKFAVLG